MKKIVTFGETMVQYNAKYTGPLDKKNQHYEDCAGAESNFLVNLMKFGLEDIKCTWISRLGQDQAGQLIADTLSKNIDIVAKMYTNQKTGLSYLNHLSDGSHLKTYYRKGSAASRIQFTDIEPHLTEVEFLHLTGITPALSPRALSTTLRTLEYCKTQSIPICLDINYREQLWDPITARNVLEKIIPFASILKLGFDEANTIWETQKTPTDHFTYFNQIINGLIIITNDSNGSFISDGSQIIQMEGFKVEVIDPVGAGDAFLAGFIGQLYRHTTIKKFFTLSKEQKTQLLKECLKIGNVCGALTCTQYGDTQAMPNIKEIEKFLKINSFNKFSN